MPKNTNVSSDMARFVLSIMATPFTYRCLFLLLLLLILFTALGDVATLIANFTWHQDVIPQFGFTRNAVKAMTAHRIETNFTFTALGDVGTLIATRLLV